jgi:DNA-directed RNA polymerase specialized sigma24 family protein
LLPDTTEEILKNCEHLLEKLDEEKLRRTAIMRLEGYSNQEISEELGCSVARTKQRLQRIRELWGELPEGE